MSQTFGQHLINSVLPKEHQVSDSLAKSALVKKLVDMAKKDPEGFPAAVTHLKKVGDEVSMFEGVTVGLDDIEPVYETRDKIMNPAMEAVKRAKTPAEREKIILETQDKMMAHSREHPGSLTPMATSGARGSVSQLMKSVASPVAATDGQGKITPWLIGKSYAEGLAPADYWVAGNESRMNTVKSSTSVAEPGDLSNILTNTMYPMIVTQDDCGTHNGIPFAPEDSQIMGRYLARDIEGFKRNELVTPQVVAKLHGGKAKYVLVRSPMTCEAHEGVCRKCQGVDERGRPHAIGINVGLRAAQALSEPLTQFSLNAKHGVRVLKGQSKTLGGLPGIRQLVEVPQTFINKATLAEKNGTVDKIVPAPHGGHYVTVAGLEHYVPPNLELLVHTGQHVEAGDVLSDGIPKPDEIVHHKGLGAGRLYFTEALHRAYKGEGQDLDRRHFELVARAELNHVRVLDHSPEHPDLLKGDIIPYEQYKAVAGHKTSSLSVDKALNHLLGKEVLHFTVGTTLTPSVIETLREHGIKNVEVSNNAPRVEFVMKPMTRNPLLNPDWMARMAHRYLKDSVLKGAHYGETSELHGAHPVPAYAYGAEFGAGKDGRY
jgi:DNA-directed RNA polymerase subunit beta'